MKKYIKLIILVIICFSSSSTIAQDGIPVVVNRVIIKIPEGEVIVRDKNFNKEEKGNPRSYYFQMFRNSNSFFPKDIKFQIEEHLVEQNFKVEGWGGLFEELNTNESPKLSIGLIINSFLIERNGMFNKLKISSTINWKVLDLETNRIVFDKIIESEYYHATAEEDEDGDKILIGITSPSSGENFYIYSREIIKAIRSFTNQFLNDPEMQQVLKKEEEKEVEAEPDSILISIPKYELTNNSQFIEKSMNGTITIKSPLGLGSGFFINNQGLILTCYHIIKEAKPIEVFLNKGVSMKAKVVKVNPEYDLALLQIESVKSFPLTLGTNVETIVGNEVYVIGTPVNEILNQSVSQGIISGKRTIDSKEFLQMDASVSPGNSGGPLLNNRGEVIGVVNAKIVAFGSEGIGFAIPIDLVLEQLNIDVK